MIEVLNLGAGVQSTTVLRMSIHGELPKLDHAIFADTWWEPREVYAHLKQLATECEQAGITLHKVSAGNLRQHVLDAVAVGKRVSSPPFYTYGERGRAVIINRSCTTDFKIDPIERKAKELIGHVPRSRLPKEPQITQWLGISGDEIGRMAKSREPWTRFWHPLIELPWAADGSHAPLRSVVMTREDCQRWLVAHGYPQAPRSACIGCPFHDNAEWRRLREDPEAWEDACQFDDAVRTFASDRPVHGLIGAAVFLHRSLKPLREAPIDVDDPAQERIDCVANTGCRL